MPILVQSKHKTQSFSVSDVRAMTRKSEHTPAAAQAIASHQKRNEELAKLIRSKGADVSVPRAIDLHFWASDQTAAHGLADALRDAGLESVSMNPGNSVSDKWNVEGRVRQSVEHVVQEAFVEWFVTLALAHRSEFDGWGTSL